jgi:hypothetical protein
MQKPKMEDFIEPIYNGNRLVAHGINFAKYAMALERYIQHLEGAKQE